MRICLFAFPKWDERCSQYCFPLKWSPHIYTQKHNLPPGAKPPVQVHFKMEDFAFKQYKILKGHSLQLFGWQDLFTRREKHATGWKWNPRDCCTGEEWKAVCMRLTGGVVLQQVVNTASSAATLLKHLWSKRSNLSLTAGWEIWWIIFLQSGSYQQPLLCFDMYMALDGIPSSPGWRVRMQILFWQTRAARIIHFWNTWTKHANLSCMNQSLSDNWRTNKWF